MNRTVRATLDFKQILMEKMLYTIAAAVLLLYAVTLVLVYFLQDRLIYYPFKNMDQTPATIGLAYERWSLVAEDGVVLSAWWIPATEERGVLLFCHGNAGNIGHRLYPAQALRRLGLSILLFDYRGYGQSGGSPSEKGTYLDAEAAWQCLVEKKKKQPGKIILFGESLGGAVAAELATRHVPGGLILQSTFTSIPELAARFYPFLPVRWLSKYKYATLDKVSAITCPKLFIHSREDEIVPFALAEALFKKATEPKQLLVIQGGHNDGFLQSEEICMQGIRSFLDGIFK